MAFSSFQGSAKWVQRISFYLHHFVWSLKYFSWPFLFIEGYFLGSMKLLGGKKSSMQSKNFMMWDVDTWDWLLSSERAKKAKHHDGHFAMYTDRRIWNLPVAEWSSILLPYITLRSVARKEINILLSWLKRKCHSLYILCTTFLRSSVQLSCRSFIWMIANQLWFFF